MSMRDEYRTRAAEFQARALHASDEMARHHFNTMADHYLQLAEIERQLDCLRDVTQEAQSERAWTPSPRWRTSGREISSCVSQFMQRSPD